MDTKSTAQFTATSAGSLPSEAIAQRAPLSTFSSRKLDQDRHSHEALRDGRLGWSPCRALRLWPAATRRCVEGLTVEIERVHREIIEGAARTVAGHDRGHRQAEPLHAAHEIAP